MPPIFERALQFYMFGSGVGLGAGTSTRSVASGLGGNMNIWMSTLNVQRSTIAIALACRMPRASPALRRYMDVGLLLKDLSMPPRKHTRIRHVNRLLDILLLPILYHPRRSQLHSLPRPTAFPTVYAPSQSLIVTDVARAEGGAMSPMQRLG
ncbi:hypothetical protein BDP27DRAFT_1336284 [Rhodocollybia butyracea]|uniref:Uncharacterized protein n=1 Tax=Rhodocollybia butyracea TaxID=206335 RepID=A0A9P5PBT0_9AGAR|nr:hypothetical protein BDP27DRAFT_1336284 [Rhodocollybia butyracea]